VVASGNDLTADQAQGVLHEIMSGAVGEAQTAGFLMALRTKGETVEELAGLARAMRELATPVDVSGDDLLDTAGTGGGVQAVVPSPRQARPPHPGDPCRTRRLARAGPD